MSCPPPIFLAVVGASPVSPNLLQEATQAAHGTSGNLISCPAQSPSPLSEMVLELSLQLSASASRWMECSTEKATAPCVDVIWGQL